MRKIGFIYMAIVLTMVVLCSGGCGRKSPKGEGVSVPVEVIGVRRGDLKETLFYVGDVRAQDEADVYPRTTGKLLEKLVKDGDKVKKDDVIAYVDRDEVGFEFEKAPVTSPIDGIVGRIYPDKGESVSPQTPVAKIVNMDMVLLTH